MTTVKKITWLPVDNTQGSQGTVVHPGVRVVDRDVGRREVCTFLVV
jgi:hypothetical protein